MKRIILSITIVLVSFFTAFAGKDKPITVDQLPVSAKQLIEAHFANTKVSYAKMETGLLDKSYEVVFTDGCKVEFDGKGEWKEVKCKRSEVPSKIVPQQIADYVNANYTGVKILEIDRDKRDYEVKLGNGLELTFDLKFNLIGIDD